MQDAGREWVVPLFAWSSFDLFLVWFLPSFETEAVACEEQELMVATQACWVSSAAASVGSLVEDSICVVFEGCAVVAWACVYSASVAVGEETDQKEHD